MTNTEFKVDLGPLSLTPQQESLDKDIERIHHECPELKEVSTGPGYSAIARYDVQPILPETATIVTVIAQNPTLLVQLYHLVENRLDLTLNGIKTTDGEEVSIGSDIDSDEIESDTVIGNVEGDVFIKTSETPSSEDRSEEGQDNA